MDNAKRPSAAPTRSKHITEALTELRGFALRYADSTERLGKVDALIERAIVEQVALEKGEGPPARGHAEGPSNLDERQPAEGSFISVALLARPPGDTAGSSDGRAAALAGDLVGGVDDGFAQPLHLVTEVGAELRNFMTELVDRLGVTRTRILRLSGGHVQPVPSDQLEPTSGFEPETYGLRNRDDLQRGLKDSQIADALRADRQRLTIELQQARDCGQTPEPCLRCITCLRIAYEGVNSHRNELQRAITELRAVRS